MLWILVTLAVVLILFFVLPRFSVISLEEARKKLEQGGHLVDVRTDPEFRQHSVPGSVNLPLQSIRDQIKDSGIQPSDPVLVFCQSGMRSRAAQRTLRQMGYLDVHNLGDITRAGAIARQN